MTPEQLLDEFLEAWTSTRIDLEDMREKKQRVLNMMRVGEKILTSYVELHLAIQQILRKTANNQEPTDAQYQRLAIAFSNSAETLHEHTKPAP